MFNQCFYVCLKTFCKAVLIVNRKYFGIHVDAFTEYGSCISVLMQVLCCGWCSSDSYSLTISMGTFQTFV